MHFCTSWWPAGEGRETKLNGGNNNPELRYIYSGLGGSVAIGLLGLLTIITAIFMTHACTPHV